MDSATRFEQFLDSDSRTSLSNREMLELTYLAMGIFIEEQRTVLIPHDELSEFTVDGRNNVLDIASNLLKESPQFYIKGVLAAVEAIVWDQENLIDYDGWHNKDITLGKISRKFGFDHIKTWFKSYLGYTEKMEEHFEVQKYMDLFSATSMEPSKMMCDSSLDSEVENAFMSIVGLASHIYNTKQ